MLVNQVLTGKSLGGELLVEGRAGTGKTNGILTYLVTAAYAWPGCKILICRYTRVSLNESVIQTLEEEVLGLDHPAVVNGPSREHRSHYQLGSSRLVLGGLDSAEKLFSTAWDLIYLCEATEASVDHWELFGRSQRPRRKGSSAAPYRQRIADCNPDYPGHWLNKRATPCGDESRMAGGIQSYKAMQAFNGTARPAPMRRILTCHQDNPGYWDWGSWKWTPDGLEMLQGLESMTGHRRARMLDGRWVAAEGAVFPEFSEAIHVVDDFTPPADWPWYVGVDPGFAHPTGAPWVCVSPVGDLYVGDEIYEGGKSIAQHVETILRMCTGRTVRKWFGDPHEFFSNRAQGESWAVQSKKAGLPTFMPWAAQEKGAMVNAYRQLLQNSVTRANTGVRPGVCLYVMRRCKNVIMEHQSWAFKRNAKGELSGGGDDQFADENNHLVGDPLVGMVATGQLRYVAPGVGAVELPNG